MGEKIMLAVLVAAGVFVGASMLAFLAALLGAVLRDRRRGYVLTDVFTDEDQDCVG